MPKEGDHYQCKIDLTLEYVLELKKISQIEEKVVMEAGTSKLQRYYSEHNGESESIDAGNIEDTQIFELKQMIENLILDLKDLTDNYLSYRIAKGIKIPSRREIRVQLDATKENTFKPTINKKSLKIDRNKNNAKNRDDNTNRVLEGSSTEEEIIELDNTIMEMATGAFGSINKDPNGNSRTKRAGCIVS